MTELRRPMLEELQLRNYSPHTQRAYIHCVADFAKHFEAAPDRLGPEHVREYQLFLVQRKKLSWSPFNQTVCALRFFYHDVLHRDWIIEHIPYPRHEQKLPVVLSPSEVAALFQSTPNLKHRAILMTIYAAGLRVSELINLQVTDIDNKVLLMRAAYRVAINYLVPFGDHVLDLEVKVGKASVDHGSSSLDAAWTPCLRHGRVMVNEG
jgi:site-specific recombinase XerD